MSQRLQLPDIPEAEPSRVRIAYLFRALPGMAYRSYAGNDGTRCSLLLAFGHGESLDQFAAVVHRFV